MASNQSTNNATETETRPHRPLKNPGKRPRPEPLTELPFEYKLIEDLRKEDPGLELEDIMKWVESDVVVKVLKAFKAQHLDKMLDYIVLRKRLGNVALVEIRDHCAKRWLTHLREEIALIKEYQKHGQQLRNGTATDVLWVRTVQQLYDTVGTPGDPDYEKLLRCRFAYALFVTVLRDLELRREGYFQRNLGGPIIADNYTKLKDDRAKAKASRGGKKLVRGGRKTETEKREEDEEAWRVVEYDQLTEVIGGLDQQIAGLQLDRSKMVERKNKLGAE